jgi:hypothetical protein
MQRDKTLIIWKHSFLTSYVKIPKIEIINSNKQSRWMKKFVENKTKVSDKTYFCKSKSHPIDTCWKCLTLFFLNRNDRQNCPWFVKNNKILVFKLSIFFFSFAELKMIRFRSPIFALTIFLSFLTFYSFFFFEPFSSSDTFNFRCTKDCVSVILISSQNHSKYLTMEST